jgi:hypothetical protein
MEVSGGRAGPSSTHLMVDDVGIDELSREWLVSVRNMSHYYMTRRKAGVKKCCVVVN